MLQYDLSIGAPQVLPLQKLNELKPARRAFEQASFHDRVDILSDRM